jgi:hypothetical protein
MLVHARCPCMHVVHARKLSTGDTASCFNHLARATSHDGGELVTVLGVASVTCAVTSAATAHVITVSMEAPRI